MKTVCHHDERVDVAMLPGVVRRTLTYGQQSLLAEFLIAQGAELPLHSHPYEQIGYLVSGVLRMTIGDAVHTFTAGESWCIPTDVPHKADALEDVVAIEVFTPVREDYK